MNAFNDAIGLQEQHHSISKPTDNRAIVAGTHDGIPPEGKIRKKDLQQPVLAEIPKFHFTRSGHARVKTDGDAVEQGVHEYGGPKRTRSFINQCQGDGEDEQSGQRGDMSVDGGKNQRADHHRPPASRVAAKHSKNIASKNQFLCDRRDDQRRHNQQEPVLQARIVGKKLEQRLGLEHLRPEEAGRGNE